jgi:uncharacterized repeat protein (TIGR01451 family)
MHVFEYGKRKIMALIVALLFVFGASNSMAQEEYTADDYFPLVIGNSWTYDDGTVTVSGTRPVNEVTTKEVSHPDGYKQCFTNDENGIRYHMEYDPAVWVDSIQQFVWVYVTFSPPILYADPVMAIGESVYSSGTASFEFGFAPGTLFPLNYSATSTAQVIENVAVPLGTFRTIRLYTEVEISGLIYTEYVDYEVIQTNWVTKGVGIIKTIDDDGTSVLTDTNIPIADLSVTKSDSPDPVEEGQNLTYTITVTNNGPDGATGVVMTDTLPPDVDFVSASPGCTEVNGIVTCSIGSILSGADAAVQIVISPTTVETVNNAAVAEGNEADPDPNNNETLEPTSVIPGTKINTIPGILLLLIGE